MVLQSLCKEIPGRKECKSLVVGGLGCQPPYSPPHPMTDRGGRWELQLSGAGRWRILKVGRLGCGLLV